MEWGSIMGKATKGAFYSNGRKKRVRHGSKATFDHGNDRVEARLNLFRCFDPKIKNEDIDDGPGQAFVAGLFDNIHADSKAMRDVARDYADLYWGYYSSQRARVGNYEPRSRTSPSSEIPCATARELRFQRLDEMMALGSPERNAMHELCVDYWGCDIVSPWLDRLLADKFSMKGRTYRELHSFQLDRDLLESIKGILIEIVQGSQQRRAA